MPEFYIFDDPILATLQIARILSEKDDRLSNLVDGMASYPYEEVNFPCSDETKFGVMEQIIKEFRELGVTLDLTDGARVNFDDGWILIRPSNTSPKIRAAIEAKSEKRLKELKKLTNDVFEKTKGSLI
jgi:phosphomannomutase